MTTDIKFDKREKRLLRLFALFAVIILVAQVLQFINNRNNENDYRKMLVSGMILIETSQKLMGETFNVHRALRDRLSSSDPSVKDAFDDNLESYAPAMKREIGTIEKIIFTTGQSEIIKRIEKDVENYEKVCRQCVAMAEVNKEKALEFRNAVVRPAFEKCQQAQADLVDILSTDLQVESDNIASASTNSSVLILLLGISPFVFLLLYLIFQSSRLFYNEFS